MHLKCVKKNMFSPKIQSFISYIRSFLVTSTAVSGLLFHSVYAGRHVLSLTAPFVFFQVLTLPRNSCIQLSRLTSVIIIIPLALLERHGRRHSNKSSNSLLLISSTFVTCFSYSLITY